MIKQEDLPLMVDLYELAMAQAYWAEGMADTAVFSLFFRELPENRNFVLACGQRHIAELIGQLRFTEDHIDRLRQLNRFQPEFLDWLRGFRFSGSIRAVEEGMPLFPQEPILEVTAPIAEAQLLESLIMNYVHLESVLASKSVRLTFAADGKPVVDFGMRRMHGLDSAHRGVRAYRLAGLAGTAMSLPGWIMAWTSVALWRTALCRLTRTKWRRSRCMRGCIRAPPSLLTPTTLGVR